MFFGGESCWALEETPKEVDEVNGATEDDTTKDVAEGTITAVVAAKQAIDVIFIVFYSIFVLDVNMM